jgi:hypothetical protein
MVGIEAVGLAGGREAEALARLGRLYAGAGRWRDAFATARKANRLYPDQLAPLSDRNRAENSATVSSCRPRVAGWSG